MLPLQFSPTWFRHQEDNEREYLILSAKVETVFTTGITEIIHDVGDSNVIWLIQLETHNLITSVSVSCEFVYLKIDFRWTWSANQYLNKSTVFISNIHRRKNGFFWQLENDTRLLLSCIFTLPRPVFGTSEVHRRMILLKLEYVTVNNEVRWLPFLKHIFQRYKSHLPGPRCYNSQCGLF